MALEKPVSGEPFMYYNKTATLRGLSHAPAIEGLSPNFSWSWHGNKMVWESLWLSRTSCRMQETGIQGSSTRIKRNVMIKSNGGFFTKILSPDVKNINCVVRDYLIPKYPKISQVEIFSVCALKKTSLLSNFRAEEYWLLGNPENITRIFL